MPIFVYRCDCGHRFERLVARDAVAPPCPECGAGTRKVPAGPRLGHAAPASAAATGRRPGPSGGDVPIPWQGVAKGGPEKMAREIEFRERLAARAAGGLRVPGGPDVQPGKDSGATSGESTSEPPSTG